MIIANGTIRFKSKTATGIDSKTGYPKEPSVSWSEPIPCQFYQNHQNLQARAGTEAAHEESYTILIEAFEKVESERLELTDDDGNKVGEFSAISCEPLKAVNQIKIVI